MTVERALRGSQRIWIDARGGGFGHAMRGSSLATLLAREGHRVTLLVRPGSEAHLAPGEFELRVQEALPGAGERIDTLIVDTFAEGVGGAWQAGKLARYERRVLCARYRKDGMGAQLYDEVWLPYPAAHDEWPLAERVQNARYLGLCARCLPPIEPSGPFVVYDPGQRLDAVLHALCTRLARASGRELEITRSLPRRAGKLLCIGAGYNTVYELLRQALDVRFLPLSRRYDDQARRVRLLGRAVASPAELASWLHAPCAARALPDAWYAECAPVALAQRGAA